MMDRYGKCQKCREEGALWYWSVLRRKYWIVGPMVIRSYFLCDECRFEQ